MQFYNYRFLLFQNVLFLSFYHLNYYFGREPAGVKNTTIFTTE
nr:MAG TPA: hypothetical protein [Caudoviricetes sp.]